MSQETIDKKYLRKQTFWDADFEKLDPKRDRSFLISRVVQRGSDKEIYYINSLIGYSEIYKVLENYKGVNEITLAFYKNMADAKSSN